MKNQKRSAFVLIVVLVTVAALALSAYTFSSLMVTHHQASKLTGQRQQARWLVDSGVQTLQYLLQQDETTREEMGGLYDNQMMFRGVPVLPEIDLASRGSFTIVAPLPDESETGMGGGIRFGLDDESTRLNLNLVLLADSLQLGRTLLMGVPGMNEEIADAILDWMDEDDEPREYGAELEYYATLTPAYEPRNGPPLAIEELLLVRGVTPELLFGRDANRNAMVDANETGMTPNGATALAATATTSMTDPTDFSNHRGWSALLTLYSAEKNVTAEGLPRIHLNGDDLEVLADELGTIFNEEQVNFIIAYRLYGPFNGGGNQPGQSAEGLDLDLTQTPSAQIAQVLDLIGAKVQIGGGGGNQGQTEGGADGGSTSGSSGSSGQGGGGQPGGSQGGSGSSGGSFGSSGGSAQPSTSGQPSQQQGGGQQTGPIIESPFQSDLASMLTYMHVLMDNCTTSEAAVFPGRININQAPREILLGIPGMTEDMVDQLVDQRAVLSDELPRDHETWILSEGLVTLEQMRNLLPFICAGGDVFRAQIVGYYQGGGPSARAELVIDATEQEPRIVLWRDISHLGRGYALEMLGVDLTNTN